MLSFGEFLPHKPRFFLLKNKKKKIKTKKKATTTTQSMDEPPSYQLIKSCAQGLISTIFLT
jgi:hypothetical protein